MLNQHDDERKKQCLLLEKDDSAFDLMQEKLLYLIPHDVAAAISNQNKKQLRFHKGINEKILYRRSEDPKSNLYVPIDDFDRIMIQESARIVKKALRLAGAKTMRSRIAHDGSKSNTSVVKVNGEYLGTGPGLEMSSSRTEDTKDAALWSLDLINAHHPFESLPEEELYFLQKLDNFHDKGHVISILQEIIDTNQPVCERLEIKVTHHRTTEEMREIAIKIAARFDPFNKFEAPTGGTVSRSKSSTSSLVYEREIEVTFFKTFDPIEEQTSRKTPKSPPPESIISRLVPKTHTEMEKILRPRLPNNLSPRNQVSVLVIGEKDAGKTSFIWTLMRAYDGLLGYPMGSHNLRPEQGMQIRVEVDYEQRAGRQDSEATILDDDLFDLREGTTTDTVDSYTITDIQYEPKMKTPGVEKKITGELKMLDTEGLRLTSSAGTDI